MPRQYSTKAKLRASSVLLVSCILAAVFVVGCNRQAASPNAVTQKGVDPAPALAKETVPITNMVPIKAGSFLRGRYHVTLTHDFWLGKYEVTQGEFAALMGSNPS